jgi:hypothetical protein
MDKVNLIGRAKISNNITTSNPPRIFRCNIGDCGATVNSDNRFSRLYDVNLTGLSNNSFLARQSATVGYQNRILNLTQASAGFIWNDAGTIATTGATNRYSNLRVNILSNPSTQNYGFIGLYATTIGQNGFIASVGLTNWNTNLEMSIFGNTTSTLYKMPFSSNQIFNPTTSQNNFNTSFVDGTFTLLTSATFGKRYLFNVSINVQATFDNGSFITFRLYKNNVVIKTQNYNLNNQSRGTNILFQDVLITDITGADVGQAYRASIQYNGGSNLTPFTTFQSCYNVNILMKEL